MENVKKNCKRQVENAVLLTKCRERGLRNAGLEIMRSRLESYTTLMNLSHCRYHRDVCL